MRRIKFEEIFSSLGNSFDRRTNSDENSSLILRSADDDAGDLILKRLSWFISLNELSFLVLPVFECVLVANDDYNKRLVKDIFDDYNLPVFQWNSGYQTS